MAKNRAVKRTSSALADEHSPGGQAEPAEGSEAAEPIRWPDGVHAAADLVGTDEAVDVSVELVAVRSRIATIAAFQRGAQAGIQLLGGGPGADPGTDIRSAARLHLTEATAAGRLRVLVANAYPLREAAAAHREIMTGHTTGKIVLVP